ncbi:MAG: cysteine peptidase family C39 domain-containing protein [Pseudomonadota bacterium]
MDRPKQLLHVDSGKRLPVVQAELAECGLACLVMIAGYHGFTTDLTSLRRKFSISSQGTGLKYLMEMATQLHLSPRALRSEIGELSSVQLPCILHWGVNHFVVLKSIQKNRYTLHDPAFGERVLDTKNFSKEFTGVVLELTPTKDFKQGAQKEILKINHFVSSIVGLARSLTQVLLLSLLLQLFAIATPFYMQTVVDDVLLRQDSQLLLVLALGFGLFMLIQTGTTALREFVILHVSNRLRMQMSANLLHHLIRLPMNYFTKRHMGDIALRADVLRVARSRLTQGLVAAVVDGALALITLAAMFFYDVHLSFMVMGVVILYGLLRWLMYRPDCKLTEESIIAGTNESSHAMESIRTIQTQKLFQRENDGQYQWQHTLADVMHKNIHIARWGIGYKTLNGLLFGVENILVIYFAATAVMGDVISLGMLYAFMSYKIRFVSSMDSLIAQCIEFKMLGIYLNHLADIAFAEPENIDAHSLGDRDELSKK